MIAYSVVVLLSLILLGLFQKGFFWKFLRVKSSFGALLMVKVREVNRDYFAIGRIKEGFLLYKVKGEKHRHGIPRDKVVLYKCLGVTWVDIDGETGNICNVDYSTSPGFDSVKYESLYTRALFAPRIQDQTTKVLLILVIISFILLLGLAIMVYTQGKKLDSILSLVTTIKDQATIQIKGV